MTLTRTGDALLTWQSPTLAGLTMARIVLALAGGSPLLPLPAAPAKNQTATGYQFSGSCQTLLIAGRSGQAQRVDPHPEGVPP